ncbi:MAG: SpoIID/LytB domain-containing protein [Armatimonadota bacterium]
MNGFLKKKIILSCVFVFVFALILNAALYASGPDEKIIRVLIGDSLSECVISSSAGFVVTSDGKEREIPGPEIKAVVNKDKVELFDDNDKSILISDKPVEIFSGEADGKLKFRGKQYRGSVVLNPGKNYFRLVNCVKLSEYLYGVLPKEMYTENAEAAKVQAVISRTFAVHKMVKNKDKDFDVYDDLRDQSYVGYDIEKDIMNDSVDLTNGLILAYNGRLAENLCYHSTCGGTTAASSDVFGGKPVTHLSSVKCDLSGFLAFLKEKDKDKYDEFKKKNKLDNAGIKLLSESLCSSSKYYKWKILIDKDQISENLPKHSSQRMGGIDNVKVLSKSKDGRNLELQITGPGRNILIRGNKMRWVMAFKDDKGVKRILYSTAFDITDRKGDVFEIHGSGWGHGVGLCQVGALKLADMGACTEDIVEFYYKGVELKNLDEI